VNNYAIDLAFDGKSAEEFLRSASYNLLVLDLGLPRLDGLELIKRLRAADSRLPILVMSGRGEDEDKVRALDLGADDYLVKPFSLKELEARVRALLRRGQCGSNTQLFKAGLCFDTVARTAMLDGKPLPLSTREAALLEALLNQFGREVSKERLMGQLYAADETPGDNAIEVFVHRLRKKLSESPVTVKTFHGQGYQLDYKESRLHSAALALPFMDLMGHGLVEATLKPAMRILNIL
jgi:DNA-binding response OmpR family regulator